jgi:hypothetical protein
VIDHSTTTEEAAGHAGGNSGKGGDLLYRWGNPQAYRAGISSDKKLFSQHDASWIKKGYPGKGNILVFNNGVGRGYSSVDEFSPPVNEDGEYYLESGKAYGPETQAWTYTTNPPDIFYAGYLSGAQRLVDGNTIICNGDAGEIFEVTQDGEKVWQYNNPYPDPSINHIFKVVYIPQEEPSDIPDLECTGSLLWTGIKPGETVTSSFQLQNIGAPGSLLNWTVVSSSIGWGIWEFNPESGKNLTPEKGSITVRASVVAPDEINKRYEGYIRVENELNPEDYDVISVLLKTQRTSPINKSLPQTLKNLLDMFQILQNLLQH